MRILEKKVQDLMLLFLLKQAHNKSQARTDNAVG